jgi:hypothetical protein
MTFTNSDSDNHWTSGKLEATELHRIGNIEKHEDGPVTCFLRNTLDAQKYVHTLNSINSRTHNLPSPAPPPPNLLPHPCGGAAPGGHRSFLPQPHLPRPPLPLPRASPGKAWVARRRRSSSLADRGVRRRPTLLSSRR